MIRRVTVGEAVIEYELTRKSVKNVNLRVRRDGTVGVSANRRVPVEYIDDFVRRNGARVLDGIARMRSMEAVPPPEVPKEDALAYFQGLVDALYPAFAPYDVPSPVVRVRYMKSRWGSCIPGKKTVTFNTRLLTYPRAFGEYVVCHELCHFLEPNHSPAFYVWLSRFMPDWQTRRAMLRENTNPAELQ